MQYNIGYAAIAEDGSLNYAPHPICGDGEAPIFTNSESVYNEHGYYRIVRTDTPTDAPENQHYEQQGWIQNGTEINPVWVLVENTEPLPTSEERIEVLETEVNEISAAIERGLNL